MWVITSRFFLMVSFVFVIFVPKNSFAASLTPSVQDISVGLGETKEVTLFLFDDLTDIKQYSLDLVDAQLGSGPDDIIFSELNYDDVKVHLADRTLDVMPEVVTPIQLFVEVEESATPRVEVFGVRVVESKSEEGGIGTLTGFVGLVFLTIGDGLQEDPIFHGINVEKKFWSKLPVQFTLNFQNDGEKMMQPIGRVEVRNIFGKLVRTIDVNPRQKRIPGDKERGFLLEWGIDMETENFFQAIKAELQQFSFGIYRLKAEILPWEGGYMMEDSVSVVIIPWRSLILVLIVFVGSLSIIKKVRKK